MPPKAKIIFYKSKVNKDGTSPIIVQAFLNGKIKRHSIENIKDDQWLPSKLRVSGRKHTRADYVNSKIEAAITKAEELLSQGKWFSKLVETVSPESFLVFYRTEIKKYKDQGQVSRFESHSAVLKYLLDFTGTDDIFFDDITEDFLYNFSLHLTNTRGNGKNTVRERMNSLVTIMKQARKRKLTIKDPFLNLTFPKERTIKRKLNADDLLKIKYLVLPKKADMIRDFFVDSVYLRGIRASDLLLARMENVKDGRFLYIERKTGKLHNTKLRPEVLETFKKWNGKSQHGYVFPILDWKPDPKKTQAENKFLFKAASHKAISLISHWLIKIAKWAGVGNTLSIHIARHTFAKMAIDSVRNPRISMELVGHSDLSIHQAYIQDITDNTELDDAADRVFDGG